MSKWQDCDKSGHTATESYKISGSKQLKKMTNKNIFFGRKNVNTKNDKKGKK